METVNFHSKTDSWSSTEVRTVKFNHMWTIKGFSQCDLRYLETTVKIKESQQQPGLSNSLLNSGLISDNSGHGNLVF